MPNTYFMCSGYALVDFLLNNQPYRELNARVENPETEPLLVTMSGWDKYLDSDEALTIELASSIYCETIYSPTYCTFSLEELEEARSGTPKQFVERLSLQSQLKSRPEAYAVGDYCSCDRSDVVSAFVDRSEQLMKERKTADKLP